MMKKKEKKNQEKMEHKYKHRSSQPRITAESDMLPPVSDCMATPCGCSRDYNHAAMVGVADDGLYTHLELQSPDRSSEERNEMRGVRAKL